MKNYESILEDASQIEEWLENQPLLLEERYHYPYDKLKDELQKFLSEGEDEDDIVSEAPVEADDDSTEVKEKKNYSLSTQGKQTKSKVKEFDDMFEDDGEDDLPF